VSFRFSRAGRHPDDPWFRIGTLDFGTTVVVVGLQVVGLFWVAVEGTFGPLMRQLPMYPDDVLNGQVWRVVTWPFFTYIDLWHVASIFFFWYFGTHLERQLQRRRTAWLYLWCTLVLAAVGLALSSFTPGNLAGIELLQFVVLLLFIAENPHARFFFNIPAWLIGVILVGIRVLGYLADRYWFGLLSFVVGLALCAVVAKSVGLLGDYRQIPSLRPRRRAQRPRRAPRRTHGSASGPIVVAGPWENVSKDQRELDSLLDKISQHGVDALTDKDRARITELRDRIRRQG